MTVNTIHSDLIKDIIKSSGNKYGATVEKSEILGKRDAVDVGYPAMNIAFSGDIDEGYLPGCMQIVGESKSFKTIFLMINMSAYLNKYPNSVAVLFDSERGASKMYFESLNIPEDRVIHLPIVSVEDLKKQFNQILAPGGKLASRDNRIFFGVDSVGLLPSDKETADAENGKSVADMTRARELNSFWRIALPKVTLFDFPLHVVNHAYDQIGAMYAKKIVKGGNVGYLAADEIWMISRSKEKDGTEIAGWNFNIRIEKSRFVKEGSRIPVCVTYEKGINYYSGILELAVESGHIIKPKNGWYALPGTDKNVREAQTGPLLDVVMADPTFKEYVRNKFQLGQAKLIRSMEEEIVSLEQEEFDDSEV